MLKKLLCVFTCVMLLLLTACQSSQVLVPPVSKTASGPQSDAPGDRASAEPDQLLNATDQTGATSDQAVATSDQLSATRDQLLATPDQAPATPEQTPELSTEQPTVSENGGIDSKKRLYDEVKLLTEAEQTTVSTMLNYLSNKRKMDVAVMTVNSISGADVLKYAHIMYDRRNYGYGDTKDGMLLLISFKERQIAISTLGKCERIYTNAVVSSILSEIGPLLTEEDYFGAMRKYVDQVDALYANKASAEIIE